MKKVLCLVLCFLMLAVSFAGCGEEVYDKDIEIPIYLSSEICSFDPAVAYTDEAAAEILGMLYEGLYKYDANGKAVPALADGCTIKEDEKNGEYSMIVTIKDSCWSDGMTLKSDDFVYAIRRILEADFYCEAASMLYCLKNARLVKSGDASIDDLGVYSVDSDTIEFSFEHKIDYEEFKEILCSPALYPLREDNVTRDANWASCASTVPCNGKFSIKKFEYGKSLIIERNAYYGKESPSDVSVGDTDFTIPRRLTINFRKNAKNNLELFNNGLLAYNSGLPLASRGEYAASATVTDLDNVLTYFFNTTKAPFDKAEVRKALSMVIDRNAVAALLTFAKPAEGLITGSVYDTVAGTSFRNTVGSLVSASADLDGAKSLLKSAGVNGGAFAITIRDNDAEEAVANYIAGEWKKLGFNVSVTKLKAREMTEEETVYTNMYEDMYTKAYKSGDFDVISVDFQMISKYAFSALAPFAKEFSGGAMDMSTGEYLIKEHITGYNDEAYNALIEEAFAAESASAKAEALHNAEKKLMEDMPVMPIITYQNAYIAKGDLSGIISGAFGINDFSRVVLENYQNYIETEAA